MTSTLVVDGGAPLVGDIEVRGAKNLVSKAMVAVVLAEEPCRLRGVPEISRRPGRQRPARAARRAHRLHRPRRRAGARPHQRRAGAHRRHRHPRRVLADAGPALRAAAAPARRGVHPRPRRLPHRRAPDQLPPRRAARVRRRRREAPGRPAAHRPARPARRRRRTCPTRAWARPSRCCSPRCAPAGITELRNAAIEPEIMDLIAILQKMGAIISVETDRVDHASRASTGWAASTTWPSPTGSRPARGPAPRWPPTATSTSRGAQQLAMMTFLNVFRKIGGAFDVDDEGIRFWHPGGTLRAHRPRDRRAPGLHDRLAAAAGRRADPDHRAVDRARDGLREPARLHRRAARHGRADPDLPRVPRRVAVPLRPRNFQHSAVISGPTPLRGRRDHRARPARRLQLPDRRAGRRGHARRCTASTSSTAATSGSRRSSTPSARPTSSADPPQLFRPIPRASPSHPQLFRVPKREPFPHRARKLGRRVSGCPRRGRCRPPTPGSRPARRRRARR